MAKEPFEFMTVVEERTHRVRNNLQLVLILYHSDVEEVIDTDHLREARCAAKDLLCQSVQYLKAIQSAMFDHRGV